jgi:CelD/BcsL family acetyltransferase involved in cellulose biosynthesis
MELSQLPGRPADWDERIAHFDSKCLFHESGWLDFVLRHKPRAHINYYSISRHGQCVGYFCAILSRRGVFRLCESPLAGRGMHLGPIVSRNIDSTELADALLRVCRRERIASLEVCFEGLTTPLMQDRGFRTSSVVKQVCPLDGGIDGVWSRMSRKRRTSIRRAEKMGLQAEIADDRVVVDHFYRIYSDVMSRKGLKPSFDSDELRWLLQHLLPSDRVFPIWVKREGEVIGAGFYPHDDRAMYFWDGASDPDSLHLSPNDLLHWTAIKLAVARGISVFNLAGGPVPQPPNRFAINFGAELQQFTVYHKSLVPFLTPARLAYRWVKGVSTLPAFQRLAAVPWTTDLSGIESCL